MEPTKEIDLAIIDVILRDPEYAENSAPAVWATVRHFLPELDTRQTAKVVSLILDICPICLAASRTCSCLHDE
jgi:hypothetical protein